MTTCNAKERNIAGKPAVVSCFTGVVSAADAKPPAYVWLLTCTVLVIMAVLHIIKHFQACKVYAMGQPTAYHTPHETTTTQPLSVPQLHPGTSNFPLLPAMKFCSPTRFCFIVSFGRKCLDVSSRIPRQLNLGLSLISVLFISH